MECFLEKEETSLPGELFLVMHIAYFLEGGNLFNFDTHSAKEVETSSSY